MTVVVTGSFDNLNSKGVRFLEEAGKWGNVCVALWPDKTVQAREGRPPRFPEQERLYLLESLRFVERVFLAPDPHELFGFESFESPLWVVSEADDTASNRSYAELDGIPYQVIRDVELSGFAVPAFVPPAFDSGRKRVLVTGCFDWFHSGHVRFFEEASSLGELYVVVGHDANVRALKGEGHPLVSQDERRYRVHAVRYVHQSLISTGQGWMDAEPEIAAIKPHFYVVNEDGDKPEKRAFCSDHGIEYIVLKRVPKTGLPRRDSTTLRGF